MTLALEIAVSLVAVAAAVFLGWRLRGRSRPRRGAARVLVPFTGGALEPRVLQAAIRIARAEEAVLVPAYLLVVPLQYSEDSPLKREVEVAMPLLEAVERTAGRAGVAVDARIEKGRTPTHALKRLWEVERFDRVLAPAPVENGPGFSPKDLTWILTHAPTETLILRPDPLAAAHGTTGRTA